ncbi:MAG TPA: flagellar hook-associated protein FlgK [Candidatus Limnocylindrales bacterium]|nr:flagellar hook-associated protein FlgK [Candidatus Limnocylindrales bacterium]
MANLLAALTNSARALDAYSQVLQVTQNNVANASTPGYVQQTQTLIALPFDPSTGDSGGVKAGEVLSSRDEYAEEAVRQQTTMLGAASQQVSSLTALQTRFDISGDTGIPLALNNLLQAFSAWGQTPNDSIARQGVLNQATDLANAFRDTAAGLTTVAQDTNRQLQQTVATVNGIVAQLRQYNQDVMQGDRHDAGLDAEVHSALEQLSTYVSFTANPQADGTVTVMLNGQTPLLIEGQQYAISFGLVQPQNPPPTNMSAPPLAQIKASDGTDITSATTSGQLGALVTMRNTTLPGLMGDAWQPGAINQLAAQFADRVNQLLTGGNISGGPSPQPGVALFTYDASDATHAAASLRVNPAITAGQLAAIDPGPPESANGIPLALSALSNPQDSAGQIDGQSFTAYYGGIASRIGSQLISATDEQQVQQSAVAQAQNLRKQSSGVDLDQEAITLVQFQQAYEANSKLVSVLNQLTQDVLNILTGS